MSEFFLKITDKGVEALLYSMAHGLEFPASKIAIGDSNGSYYDVTGDETSLKNQKYSGLIFAKGKKRDEKGGYLYFCLQIPPSVGDFTIREAGLLDNEDSLLAIAKFPETLKIAADEAQAKTLNIELRLYLNNEIINVINIDDSGNLITEEKLFEYQLINEKGEANGYAPLNEECIIPDKFLPASTWGNIEGEITDQTDLIELNKTVPFSVYKGSVDENGKPDVAYVTGYPVQVIKSLPTFANTTEAANGIDGITVSPSSAYRLIGRTSKLADAWTGDNGYGGTLTIDMGKEVVITHIFYIEGGTGNYRWPFGLVYANGSNDGSNWTTIINGNRDYNTVNVDFTDIAPYRYFRFGFDLPSAYQGTPPYGAAGGLNIEYIAETIQGDSNLYFNANLSNPVTFKTAGDKVYTLSSIMPLDLSGYADGSYQVMLTPNGAEIKDSVIRQANQPSSLVPFVQPQLSANGTMGGNNFACDQSSTAVAVSHQQAWNCFNSNNSYWESSTPMPQWITWYNPNPLNTTKLTITNGQDASGGSGISAGIVQGSNDNNNWVDLKTFTNSSTGVNQVWKIDLSNNQNFYKYYRIYVTNATYIASGNKYAIIKYIEITATERINNNNSVWYDGYEAYTVQDGEWQPYEGVPLASVTVADNAITEVKNYDYRTIEKIPVNTIATALTPDLTTGIERSNTGFTSDKAQWLFIYSVARGYLVAVNVNNVPVFENAHNGNSNPLWQEMWYLLKAGDIVTTGIGSGGSLTLKTYDIKGV